ncbi:Pentatricopeptide repeat-containing protein, partial [Durusdinium trenchii]
MATRELWQKWHSHHYEEAVTEVCTLLEVHEQAFASDQELLNAASDLGQPGATPSPGLGREDLALFGAACCNRLAEQQRSDWRQSAHWCALARQFEGHGSLHLDGPGPERPPGRACQAAWATSRFQRLFTVAEAARAAAKAAKATSTETAQWDLQTSEKCLKACEDLWQRWPSCSSSPESIYTCLAEVCWQLKDMESVRSSCRKALSLFMSTDRLSPAKAYACMFVLWVFQSAALDVFSWREVRAALQCAKDLFERLQKGGAPEEELRPHQRILRRLQRQGQVVPMAPIDLQEAQLDLGLSSEKPRPEQQRDQQEELEVTVPATADAAVMTEAPGSLPDEAMEAFLKEVAEHPSPPADVAECSEILDFLQRLDE